MSLFLPGLAAGEESWPRECCLVKAGTAVSVLVEVEESDPPSCAAEAAAASAAITTVSESENVQIFNSIYDVVPDENSDNYLSISTSEFTTSQDYGSFDGSDPIFTLKLYFVEDKKFEISFEDTIKIIKTDYEKI